MLKDELQLAKQEMKKVIIGKDQEIELVLIAFLAQGHLLIEDVPGVGKTTLAKTMASIMGCGFTRIQFTPDTLPSDVTGVSVYKMDKNAFEFMPGAIMNNIILADEINRATPKTQSSLLEAMGEKQISVDGTTYKLPDPFMVIATQNPIDELGTYILPEAQLDRFMMKMKIGYPKPEDEITIARNALYENKTQELNTILDSNKILKMQAEVRKIYIHPDLLTYMTNFIALTRKHESILLGASPRALIAWAKATQACAYLEGREYVIPDDMIRVMNAVLEHRILLTQDAKMNRVSLEGLMLEIRNQLKLPVISGIELTK